VTVAVEEKCGFCVVTAGETVHSTSEPGDIGPWPTRAGTEL
jgi:hypothetical protein